MANRELSPGLAFRLGRAGAAVLVSRSGKTRARVAIGKDTRVSGEMLEAAMIAGVTSVGADVVQLGIVPTGAVAYLTRELQVDAGVMISASHNPVEDNGIKFFSRDGFKLPDEVEDRIEALVGCDGSISALEDGLPAPVGGAIGRGRREERAIDLYLDFLVQTFREESDDLRGIKVVVDCANGAAYDVGPRALLRLGAELIPIETEHDGMRINVDCGSTHPEVVARAVVDHQADVGLALDGDADRCIAVDERGGIVDGDKMLAICGLHMLGMGALPENAVAATVYSNLGLKMALEEAGGKLLITKPGDRYVLEEMVTRGLGLGGEQSGHIIFLRHNTTGDGLLTGLKLLAIMKAKSEPLSGLARCMQTLPQTIVNVRVSDKGAVESSDRVAAAIEEAALFLGRHGRLLVRPSGTEPVVRVMAEGLHQEEVRKAAEHVARVIGEGFGSAG